MTKEQEDVLALLELRQITTAQQVQELYDWTDETVQQRDDLAAEAASLRKELDATKDQLAHVPPPAPPPSVTNVTTSVRIEFSDGSRLVLPHVKGELL